MNSCILSKEDILCMQYAGMKPSRIMSPKLMPEEYAEAFEAYIDKAESVMSMQEEYGVITLTFQDDNFPRSLRKIGNDCPPIIHCIGDLSLLAPTANCIAVIGARAASPIGLRIAIVASGLNIVHPKENAPLQQRILENGGLILSEQPFGVKANPTRLVARNRLQAALSSTVILTECPEQSGSMHTMRFARKYHKRCLMVSYPEYNDKNAGNELLINLNLANAI